MRNLLIKTVISLATVSLPINVAAAQSGQIGRDTYIDSRLIAREGSCLFTGLQPVARSFSPDFITLRAAGSAPAQVAEPATMTGLVSTLISATAGRVFTSLGVAAANSGGEESKAIESARLPLDVFDITHESLEPYNLLHATSRIDEGNFTTDPNATMGPRCYTFIVGEMSPGFASYGNDTSEGRLGRYRGFGRSVFYEGIEEYTVQNADLLEAAHGAATAAAANTDQANRDAAAAADFLERNTALGAAEADLATKLTERDAARVALDAARAERIRLEADADSSREDIRTATQNEELAATAFLDAVTSQANAENALELAQLRFQNSARVWRHAAVCPAGVEYRDTSPAFTFDTCSRRVAGRLAHEGFVDWPNFVYEFSLRSVGDTVEVIPHAIWYRERIHRNRSRRSGNSIVLGIEIGSPGGEAGANIESQIAMTLPPRSFGHLVMGRALSTDHPPIGIQPELRQAAENNLTAVQNTRTATAARLEATREAEVTAGRPETNLNFTDVRPAIGASFPDYVVDCVIVANIPEVCEYTQGQDRRMRINIARANQMTRYDLEVTITETLNPDPILAILAGLAEEDVTSAVGAAFDFNANSRARDTAEEAERVSLQTKQALVVERIQQAEYALDEYLLIATPWSTLHTNQARTQAEETEYARLTGLLPAARRAVFDARISANSAAREVDQELPFVDPSSGLFPRP